MRAGLRTGILLPSREAAMTGEHDAAGVVRFAREAEEAGFDSVWAGDSPLARSRMDPLALLAAAAAVTTRVSLGTAALTAALRHPLLGAHAAATVDQVSRGRLILGLGSGFPTPESEREFSALGVPFAGRVRRTDETAELWKQLWASGTDSAEQPKPASRPDLIPPVRASGPPLWLAGGDTPRVIARVAERYDGWLPFLPDPGKYATAWQKIRAEADSAGRSVTAGLYATINLNIKENRARDELDAYVRAYYRRPLAEMSTIQASFAGSPAHCLDWLGRYVAAGARHIILRLGRVSPRPDLDAAAALARDLRAASAG